MGRHSGLFLHGGPTGRHSITALMGALEEKGLDSHPEASFALGAFEITQELRRFITEHDPCAVGLSFMTYEKKTVSRFISMLRKEFGSRLFLFCGGPPIPQERRGRRLRWVLTWPSGETGKSLSSALQRRCVMPKRSQRSPEAV